MGTNTIKRPLPYLEQQNKRTFKAGVTIIPGDLVIMTSGGTINKAGAGDDDWIGNALYDHAHVADSGTEYYAAGKLIPVHMRGTTIKVENTITLNPIARGNFVKMAVNGGVQVEATAGTKTLDTTGIALTAAGTLGDTLEVVTF